MGKDISDFLKNNKIPDIKKEYQKFIIIKFYVCL